MNRKNIFKIVIAFVVVLALVLPSSAMFDNIGTTINNTSTSSKEDNNIDLQTLDDSISVTETVDWWPMSRHDLNNTGYSTSTAPNTNNLLWSYDTGIHPIYTSAAILDGKVYFGSNDHNVYCLNASDGSLIWSYTTGDKVKSSSPAVIDGKVYIGSHDNNVYCLNASDGSIIWIYATEHEVYSSPAVADGKVFIGSNDYNLYCLDALDGSLIWKYTTGKMVQSSPAVAYGNVFFGSNDRSFYCLDATDGSLIWSCNVDGTPEGAAAVVDGKIFFVSSGRRLYCRDVSDGSVIWEYIFEDDGDMYLQSPAVAYGRVFVGSWTSDVYCLDAMDGSLIWSYTTGGWPWSPSVAEGKIYFGCTDGNVYCLNAVDGSLIWNYYIGAWMSYAFPAIADGKVFIGFCDGKLYCFGLFPGHDVGIVSIDSPANSPFDVITPEVTVINQGTFNEIDVPVNLQITKIGTDNVEYNETVTIDIDSEESKVAVFPEWTPEDIGVSWSVQYSVTACTQMTTDEKPDNDCESKMIGLYPDGIDWWSMHRHDLNNTGFSTSTAPETNNVLWEYIDPVGPNAGGYTPPAIADGKVYFGSFIDDNYLYCLDAYDGTFIWKYAIKNNIHCSPTVADGKVYFGSEGGKIYCLNAMDGSFIWKYVDGGFTASSPAVADGKVYTSNRCLNATDGSVIWISAAGYISRGAPAVADGKVFIGSGDSNVYCLDATDGSIIWTYATDGEIQFSSTAVADGRVYIGSWDHNVYCLDATDGSLIWNYTTNHWVISSPVVAYGKVFIGSADDYLYCLDATDGSLIWKYNTRGTVTSSPAVADGKVYIGSHDFHIYCLNESDGTLIWRYCAGYFSFSSPSIADRRIYFGAPEKVTEPKIYCLGPTNHDVGVASIISPFSGDDTVFTPEATVKNFGLNNETDISMNMEIYEVTGVWTEIVYSGTGHWEQCDYAGNLNPHWKEPSGTGLYYAKADAGDYIPDIFDVGLFTPSLDLSGLSSATLEFEIYFNKRDSDRVEVNTYSGGIREEHLAIYTGDTKSHKAITFDPSGYTDPSDVYIEFYFRSSNAKRYYDWVSIDDVVINEIGFSEGFEDVFPPAETVLIPEYNETVTIEDIDPGESINIVFPDWTPDNLNSSIRYVVKVSSQMTGDDFPGNDHKAEIITLDYIAHDVGVKEITEPSGPGEWLPPGTYPVEAVVKNYGSFNESNFNVNATIYKDDDVFYHDDVMVNTVMYPQDEITVAFSDVTFEDEGNYRLEMITELDGDENQLNDQAVMNFVIGEDTTSPVTTCDLDGIMEGDVYITDVTVTLTATDDASGVAETFYRLNNGEWQEYSAFVVSEDGAHTISFYSIDNAGNIEDIKTETFTIQHPCSIEIEVSGGIGVNVVITNTGDTDVTDLEWSINITGGILGRINKEVNGTIPILVADDSVTVKSGIFLGLGKIAVSVTVECDDGSSAEETADGKQIIIFTIIN